MSSLATSTAQAAVTAFLLVLVALHGIQPGLDPSWRVISEYALGPFGWLMSLGFLALGAACAALVAALRPLISSKVGWIGLFLLLASTLGFVLAAAFPTDPVTIAPDQATTSGGIHAAGAALGGLIPLAAIFVTFGVPRGMRPPLWLGTAAAWVGEITFIGAMVAMLPEDGRLGPSVLIGWPNRVMIVGYCVWLFVAARQLGKPAPGTVGAR